jgi:transposase
MAGKSPIAADEEQRQALVELSQSHDRGEADRARAVLLTLSGWTSGRIAEAFGVREDTVRLWRSLFMMGGIAALRRRVAPGPAPVKANCALAVAQELLDAPVADRANWTLPRLAEEIDPSTRSGAFGGADLTLALIGGAAQKRGFGWRRPRHTLKGRQSLPRRRPGTPMPSIAPGCAASC